jgi:DNA-binding MarR family transcriptional regulator
MTPEEELAAVEAALIRVRRRQAKRALGRASNEGLAEPVNLDHFAALDAVEEGLEAGRGAGEVTIGDVAERLGIDPSRASRVVAGAIAAGYLRRVASQADGRRTCLAITDAGSAMLDHAHRSRRALIDGLLADWTPDDRADFARLFARFAAALAAR